MNTGQLMALMPTLTKLNSMRPVQVSLSLILQMLATQ